MIEIQPFHMEHLAALNVQPAQAWLVPHFQTLAPLYESGPAYTVMRDGRPAACAGLLWTSRGAHLWALLSRAAPMVALTRAARRLFEVYAVRLTATVETGFAAGIRWLEMLGFRRTETVPGFGSDGSDHHIYVREP